MTGVLVRGAGRMGRPGGMPLWQWQSAGESRWARDGARQRGSATCGKQSDLFVTLLTHLFTQRAGSGLNVTIAFTPALNIVQLLTALVVLLLLLLLFTV